MSLICSGVYFLMCVLMHRVICVLANILYLLQFLKGIATSISPDRTRLISILLSNFRLPGHLSPDLWHSMLIILILLIHATTRQQWNASWQSKRRRSAQILSTAIVTVARNSNGNETGRDSSRRASLPCARVKTVIHSKLHIRFSDAKTVDGYSG